MASRASLKASCSALGTVGSSWVSVYKWSDLPYNTLLGYVRVEFSSILTHAHAHLLYLGSDVIAPPDPSV